MPAVDIEPHLRLSGCTASAVQIPALPPGRARVFTFLAVEVAPGVAEGGERLLATRARYEHHLGTRSFRSASNARRAISVDTR
jgi:hypothetical protein